MPQQGGGMLSGLAGTVMQGMALGTGSAMAHRAVDAVLGSRHPPPAEAQQAAQQIAAAPSEPCAEQARRFTQCMEAFDGDMGPCQASALLPRLPTGPCRRWCVTSPATAAELCCSVPCPQALFDSMRECRLNNAQAMQ